MNRSDIEEAAELDKEITVLRELIECMSKGNPRDVRVVVISGMADFDFTAGNLKVADMAGKVAINKVRRLKELGVTDDSD